MRILLASKEPGSRFVHRIAESLVLWGHSIQYNLRTGSPDAVIAFSLWSAARAAGSFPEVPMAVYLPRAQPIPGDIARRNVLCVFPFSCCMEKCRDEQEPRTTFIAPPLCSLGMDWRYSVKSRAVLIPGSLDHSSGHMTFLRALALLPEEITGFVWGEEGDYAESDIGKMASDNGVRHRISFIGDLSSVTAAVAVVPDLSAESSYEITGGVMAMGFPLLLSSSGFHRSLVTDGVTGLLHSPGNHRQLAGQIDHLMHNHDLSGYLSGNAVRYCRNELSPEVAGKRWTEELEQLCSL